METCRFCGARLYEGAIFCARCLAPLAVSEEGVAEGLVEVHAASGLWRPRETKGTSWRPGDRFTETPSTPVLSRFHGSALSFGPRVKIVATAFIVLLPVVVWIILPLVALEFVLVWCTIIAPLVLRDLWKRRRIR